MEVEEGGEKGREGKREREWEFSHFRGDAQSNLNT